MGGGGGGNMTTHGNSSLCLWLCCVNCPQVSLKKGAGPWQSAQPPGHLPPHPGLLVQVSDLFAVWLSNVVCVQPSSFATWSRKAVSWAWTSAGSSWPWSMLASLLPSCWNSTTGSSSHGSVHWENNPLPSCDVHCHLLRCSFSDFVATCCMLCVTMCWSPVRMCVTASWWYVLCVSWPALLCCVWLGIMTCPVVLCVTGCHDLSCCAVCDRVSWPVLLCCVTGCHYLSCCAVCDWVSWPVLFVTRWHDLSYCAVCDKVAWPVLLCVTRSWRCHNLSCCTVCDKVSWPMLYVTWCHDLSCCAVWQGVMTCAVWQSVMTCAVCDKVSWPVLLHCVWWCVLICLVVCDRVLWPMLHIIVCCECPIALCQTVLWPVPFCCVQHCAVACPVVQVWQGFVTCAAHNSMLWMSCCAVSDSVMTCPVLLCATLWCDLSCCAVCNIVLCDLSCCAVCNTVMWPVLLCCVQHWCDLSSCAVGNTVRWPVLLCCVQHCDVTCPVVLCATLWCDLLCCVQQDPFWQTAGKPLHLLTVLHAFLSYLADTPSLVPPQDR